MKKSNKNQWINKKSNTKNKLNYVLNESNKLQTKKNGYVSVMAHFRLKSSCTVTHFLFAKWQKWRLSIREIDNSDTKLHIMYDYFWGKKAFSGALWKIKLVYLKYVIMTDVRLQRKCFSFFLFFK